MKQLNLRKVCSDYYQHQINHHLPEPLVETNYFERTAVGADPVEELVEELDGIKGFTDLVKDCSSSSPWDL